MTKHEIHLRFMEAAIARFGEFNYPMHEEAAKRASDQADHALAIYLKRWPDIKFED